MAIPFYCPILRHLPLYEDCHYCPNLNYLEQKCELAEVAEPMAVAPERHHPNAYQQIQGELRHLEKELNEHIDFAKKKKAVIKTGYKGLAT